MITKKYINTLHEVRASLVRVGKKTKINQQSGISAMRIARERNDPLYDRYLRYKELYYTTRQKILDKYQSRGLRAARKMLSA